MGEQPRAGESSRDRSRGRLGLHDLLAARAGELGAHMANYPEARRDVVEHLGDILANLAHRLTAVRAGAGRGVYDPFSGEVFR